MWITLLAPQDELDDESYQLALRLQEEQVPFPETHTHTRLIHSLIGKGSGRAAEWMNDDYQQIGGFGGFGDLSAVSANAPLLGEKNGDREHARVG